MGSFLKTFLASLLALFVFGILAFFFMLALIGALASNLTSGEAPSVREKSVLVLDLSEEFREQMRKTPLSAFRSDYGDVPGLYDVVRMIKMAAADKRISGILITANNSPNGFAAGEEVRNALLEFKKSGKFIIAHGDVISQRAYSVANVADRFYVSPQGMLEWVGLNVDYIFLKGTLDKLDVEPQIFYAGKFKSATEPFRVDKMTPENRLQTSVWLNQLYANFLVQTSAARKIDTATLHKYANEGLIQTAEDAVGYKLLDGIKYDDEVKDEIRQKIQIEKSDRINFISMSGYHAAEAKGVGKGEKVALIYAEGDIIDGKSDQGMIGSETYRNLIRKARLDKSVKAIVFRINSGGGSALASENIWRELSLAKTEKPVVVSFGDVAASGGYYIACGADSIFASPNTITGSIGVFGIIPNMEGFFKNKLGITFDGVKTAEYADMMSVTKPMSENGKRIIQAEIELIYSRFKERVADGRKMDTAAVENIAQGRVWAGTQAKEIGLVDKFGGLTDAVQCAARMAKLTEFRLLEYPEVESFLERLFGPEEPISFNEKIREEIGEQNYDIFLEMKRIRQITNSPQARMPFRFLAR